MSLPGADGMKTGFICESGFNVVASATRDGRKLVAVVLGEQSIATRRARATDLLENGFKRYFWKSLFGTSIDGLAIASLLDRWADAFERRHLRRGQTEAVCDAQGQSQGRLEEAQHCQHRRELNRVSFQLLRLAAAAALALPLAHVAARAAEPPDNVAQAIVDADQACTDLNGKPNHDAVLTVEDVNGDGGEDWIADYSKLKCEGGINPLCSDGACTLQIYLWDGETQWDLLFEDLVQSYKFGKVGGKHMLYVTTPGTPCNKPVAETCKYEYRLDKDAIVPVNP